LAAAEADDATLAQSWDHLNQCAPCRAKFQLYQENNEFLANARQALNDDTDHSECGPNRTGETLTTERSPVAKLARHFPKIAGYEIQGVVGQGGMGIVYRAVQTKLNRAVALKVLPAVVGSANPSAVVRFRREATAAAGLHHTNIIPIYDFGESSDAYYYAMELIAGRPFDAVIQACARADAMNASPGRLTELLRAAVTEDSQPVELPPDPEPRTSDRGSGSGTSSTGRGRQYYRQVARWVADVADGLQHAHEQGIIHRDIKPSNLILSVDGRIMIADFGLARGAEPQSLTLTGSLMGTLRYMSPEQAMAKRVRVDHRTDVYSLGVTMYEMLTLQPAFAGADDKEVLGAVIAREPTRPRKVISSVPHELETICQKMMEKSPDARYSTARAVAEDLRRYINDLPIEAKRPGVVSRTVKFVRRHKASVTAALAVLLLVIAAGVVLEQQKQASNARIKEEQARISKRKTQISALLGNAQRSMEVRQWQQADSYLMQAKGLDPHSVDVLYNLARLKKDYCNEVADSAKTDLLEEAKQLCETALELNPGHVDSWNMLGVVMKKLGDYDGALRAYQQYTTLNADGYAGWVNLGTTWAVLSDLAKAEEFLRKSVALAESLRGKPNFEYSVDTWRNLASLQLYQGQIEAAALNIATAIACQRQDIGSWLIQARLQLQVGDLAAASGSLTDAGSKERDRLAADAKAAPEKKYYRMAAIVALRIGEYEQAIGWAAKAIAFGDLPTVNHLVAAVACAELNDFSAAREHLQQAELAWPENLRQPGSWEATADAGVLWFETADELIELRERLGELIGSRSNQPQ
jgi:serine/threonine protein kinase/Tfp pilus assembly protein PilF